MKIASRTSVEDTLNDRFDHLVDRLDDFLEMRIAAGFAEYEKDFAELHSINKELLRDNLALKEQNARLSLSIVNGNLIIHTRSLDLLKAAADQFQSYLK